MGAIIDKNKMNKLPSSIGLGGRLLDYVCGENEESIPMWRGDFERKEQLSPRFREEGTIIAV